MCCADEIPIKNMTPVNFITAYENALATQDWAEVDPLVHPNCTVTFSDGTLHRGKAAVERAFRRNFSLIESEKYVISDVHWIVKTNDFATYTFVYEWSGIMNGQQISGAGRGTSSLVREDGIWLLATEHLGPKAGD